MNCIKFSTQTPKIVLKMFLRHNESHFQREINNTLSLFVYLNFLHSFLFFFSNTEKKKINCVKSSAKKNKFNVTQ